MFAVDGVLALALLGLLAVVQDRHVLASGASSFVLDNAIECLVDRGVAERCEA